jgi:hypothetical protein
MTLRNTQSPDEYRMPLTPDGAVEFAPDSTGVEQIDLPLSSLERMTREAIGFAEASEPASAERSDSRRGEYGEHVVDLLAATTPERVIDITEPGVLLGLTTAVYKLRQVAIDESNRAA